MEAFEFRELFPSLIPNCFIPRSSWASGTGLALAQKQQGQQNDKGFASMDLLVFVIASLTIIIVVSAMR